jgi:hypothetical protein
MRPLCTDLFDDLFAVGIEVISEGLQERFAQLIAGAFRPASRIAALPRVPVTPVIACINSAV